MVKKLEDTNFGNFSNEDVEKLTAYPLRNDAENQTAKNNLIGDRDGENISVYLCDCDQWGGGDPPCDHSRC